MGPESWWARLTGMGLCGVIVLMLLSAVPAVAADTLENDAIEARFDANGLISLRDKATQKTTRFASDGFSVLLGDQSIESEFIHPAVEQPDARQRIYRFNANRTAVRVIYELRPGWRFISKRIVISGEEKKPVQVRRIETLRARIADPVSSFQKVRDGALLRFGTDFSLFLVQQNPFLQWKLNAGLISMAYAPDMAWTPSEGAFEADRVCIGTCALTGRTYRAAMVPEWKYYPGAQVPPGATIDEAEVDGLIACVRAFLLYQPTHSIRLHVGWCENDYQISIDTPEGRAEYKRIIDRAASVGCHDVLFTPANDAMAPLKDNRDAWGWENVLWLTLGQKIREGKWDPAKDPIPASVQEMLDYARSRDVKFVAYVYPSLPFMQNPAWTSWIKGRPGGYLGADTGQRSFQDWLLTQMEVFAKRTGIGGFCFDHWWIAYDETPSSKYAQWYGCRRILESLRRAMPEAIIDGRQQYHYFGVWTWLAGTYPHPLNSDEQPASFKSFTDLHWDRGSADRQRYISWWYRIHCFVPPEIMPGYMTHQTERNEPGKGLHRDRFRATDWDYLGWRYSVISSIGTAPFNHVINMLPARDESEFKAFSEADQKWFRDWLDFTDRNFQTLRNVRPILGQPMVGKTDGTAAFKDGKGFVFLYNPNYRPLPAEFSLDASIGLDAKGPLVIRQLYPDAEKGRLLAAPDGGFWKPGAKASLMIPGTGAMVLEVTLAPQKVERPVLMNSVGTISLDAGTLSIDGALGEPGTSVTLAAVVPAGATVQRVTVNGRALPFQQEGERVQIPLRYAGERFTSRQQVGSYDQSFAGGTWKGSITIPRRIVTQLERRKRQWPIAYTADDLKATWLGSSRLLLFINIAEPSEEMPVAMRIDGKPVDVKKAYTSVYPENPRNTFVGWYVDVSSLAPDAAHAFEMEMPKLAPGQFQGLYFDTVEADYTGEVAGTDHPAAGVIRQINPPEDGFFAKELDYDGIVIKASQEVVDQALLEARDRLAMMMDKLPTVRENLARAGAQLQIIGRNQVTSDLPELRHLKGTPFDGKLTVDERTRGLGGLHTSCGEENLLRLPVDRYRGRDICVHEFAHNIYRFGVSREVRAKFRAQVQKSRDAGLWTGSYAATNEDEFFAELSMWYWGTHGDLHMKGSKPANGREGLEKYDPQAFKLFDDLYSGRMAIAARGSGDAPGRRGGAAAARGR